MTMHEAAHIGKWSALILLGIVAFIVWASYGYPESTKVLIGFFMFLAMFESIRIEQYFNRRFDRIERELRSLHERN